MKVKLIPMSTFEKLQSDWQNMGKNGEKEVTVDFVMILAHGNSDGMVIRSPSSKKEANIWVGQSSIKNLTTNEKNEIKAPKVPLLFLDICNSVDSFNVPSSELGIQGSGLVESNKRLSTPDLASEFKKLPGVESVAASHAYIWTNYSWYSSNGEMDSSKMTSETSFSDRNNMVLLRKNEDIVNIFDQNNSRNNTRFNIVDLFEAAKLYGVTIPTRK
jgi:hypothetical protein